MGIEGGNKKKFLAEKLNSKTGKALRALALGVRFASTHPAEAESKELKPHEYTQQVDRQHKTDLLPHVNRIAKADTESVLSPKFRHMRRSSNVEELKDELFNPIVDPGGEMLPSFTDFDPHLMSKLPQKPAEKKHQKPGPFDKDIEAAAKHIKQKINIQRAQGIEEGRTYLDGEEYPGKK